MDFAFYSMVMDKLVRAMPMTLALFALSIAFGFVLALLVVWMRVGGNRLVQAFARGYIFVFRGSPLLIQLFLIYNGLAQFRVFHSPLLWPLFGSGFWCAVLGLALCTAGYSAEIFRGGIRAVPAREIEAARAIGMSGFLLVRRIIAPIAFRHALPAYSTEIVMMLKSTALASLVTVIEMMATAASLAKQSYRPVEVFTCAGILYLLLNFVIIQALGLLERRLSRHRRALRAAPVAAIAPS